MINSGMGEGQWDGRPTFADREVQSEKNQIMRHRQPLRPIQSPSTPSLEHTICTYTNKRYNSCRAKQRKLDAYKRI